MFARQVQLVPKAERFACVGEGIAGFTNGVIIMAE
jgi:hypothetical protein